MIFVQVYIINENNELLLGKYENMDLWSVPMAWINQEDQGFKKCGQRAVLQETGMVVENLERYSIAHNSTFSIMRKNEKIATERVVIAFYTTRHVSGQPQLIHHEVRDWLHAYKNYEYWQWCSAENLPANIDDGCLTHKELSEILK